MNILSLFDGMSCGQLALNRANVHYDKYYASEIGMLTVNKVERLQTLKKDYTKVGTISDSNRMELIGNGWTVDVISHILSFIG